MNVDVKSNKTEFNFALFLREDRYGNELFLNGNKCILLLQILFNTVIVID